jgi:hypothetical protein
MSSLPARLDILPPPAPGGSPSRGRGGTSLLQQQPSGPRPPAPVRLKSQELMSGAALKRNSHNMDDDDSMVFAMDIDDDACGPSPPPREDEYGEHGPPLLVDETSGVLGAAEAGPKNGELGRRALPGSAAASGTGKARAPPLALRFGSAPLPHSAPMAAPEPARGKSAAAARRTASSDAMEGAGIAPKKPRRQGSSGTSHSLPSSPMFGPAGVPLLGVPLLKPPAGLGPGAGSSSSVKSSPKLGPKAMPSPLIGPQPTGGLTPLEADLQPHALLRAHEFKKGRRIFHVHFGHGFVKSMDGPEDESPRASASLDAARPISQSQNINVHFDNPKYKQLRLRAFYAVPKMVVIPSSSALRRQKLHAVVSSTPPLEAPRKALVRSLLAAGSIRSAAKLVLEWGLQEVFPPAQLVERLQQHKSHSAAVRFAREFGLSKELPPAALLEPMVAAKQYEGVLKYANTCCALVDGKLSPKDVLSLMVRDGHDAVALKYVHKFKLSDCFPPAELVARCLEGEGELTVRTCGLLLKYVRVFGLEDRFPIDTLLERVTRSGVTVHEMDGRYVLKGRRRLSVSQAGTGSPSIGTSPLSGTSPVGSAPT